MKRILLMVFRNIIFVPYWFCQLLWYAAHTDSIPEEKKLALLKKIVVHANAGGNVTVITMMGGNVIVNVKEARVAISKEMAQKIMI